MAIALKLDTTTGYISQLTTSDDLDIDVISQRTSGVDMTIGANLGAGDELQLGKSGEIVRVMGDLNVDGSETVSVSETVTGTFNANGDVNLGNNSGDTVNLGGGTSDTVALKSDLSVGTGLVGIGSSVTDYLTELWLVAVNDNGPDNAAYNLAASGTNAGAYSIGVDPSLLSHSTATDLMTALDEIDAAIGGGGTDTLQDVYDRGNTIAVTSAEGIIDFSNDTNTDTTTVLEVSRTPTASTGGIALQVTMGANTTGTAVEIDNAGSGAALDVQDGGSSVLVVDGAGAVDITPTSGQDLTLTAAGAGTIPVSAAGLISLTSSGAAVNISAAAASSIATSAGNLSLDAAAAELVFDDVGDSGITLSETGDRTLDQTGTGQIFDGITSIIGALNALVNVSAVGAVHKAPIENTITISAGDCVAQSTTSGRVTQGNANANTNSRFVGIALVGGTGDAGGTVYCEYAMPGSFVTDSGASFTAGAALFMPDGTGRPVPIGSAPTDTGDAFKRLGFAHTSTTLHLDPGPTIILG